MIVALNALAAVAKVRLDFSKHHVLPALLSLARTMGSAPATTTASASHSLKTILLSFLRVRALEGTEWPEKIAEVLSAAPFNAREQIDQLRKHNEYVNLPRRAPEEPTPAPTAKRARTEVRIHEAMAKGPGLF